MGKSNRLAALALVMAFCSFILSAGYRARSLRSLDSAALLHVPALPIAFQPTPPIIELNENGRKQLREAMSRLLPEVGVKAQGLHGAVHALRLWGTALP